MVVVMFSRTGRRSLESVPPAHLYVLPLIVVAGIMTVLSVISTNLLFNGLEVFCKFFVHLTGKTECSPYMDYFTKEQRRGYRHLYFHILACKKSFLAAAIFWICQLIVGLLRVLTADDYTFTTVLIESKSKLHEEDAEEIFLMHWDSVAAPQLAAVVEKLKKEYVENQ
ncbi:uncharacterized protein LOC130451529 [Diorhabda sublineata]|uniref:uncharacterized protein LOC130451529 n=1 Tax=Diorhabda sublineata TaxID=1163346 RepID=UPI0024E14BE0|nr:uncharacterized protein LOC130451529 [Diorhabda sublineata]